MEQKIETDPQLQSEINFQQKCQRNSMKNKNSKNGYGIMNIY